MDLNLEITVDKNLHHNVLVEIYQNQQSGLYGLNVKLGEFNLRTPATSENLEALQKLVRG